MEHIDLTAIVDDRKTLVIACIDCCVFHRHSGRVNLFIYNSLAMTIHFHDDSLKQTIEYFVLHKDCTRVILAGHLNCRALRYLLANESTDTRTKDIRHRLREVVAANHIPLAPDRLRERMLVETMLTMLARSIMSYDFVQERIERGRLSVEGMLADTMGINVFFKNNFNTNSALQIN